MSQKKVIVPDIGEVVLAKRKGARNIRLSVTATGQVRVSMPHWAPYDSGINFALSRSDWIQKHLQKHSYKLLEPYDQVGKAHRLKFVKSSSGKTQARVTQTEVIVSSNHPYDSPEVQQKAAQACEKALAQEAMNLLPQRLDVLAKRYGFDYKSVKVKKLTARWGSCSSHKSIALSYYLMQMPWHLIDYVILHELVHTEHLNHGPNFWERMTDIMPNAKKLRKEIHAHRPALQAA